MLNPVLLAHAGMIRRRTMTQPKSPGLQDDYLGTVHEFASWEEFFEDCMRLHAKGVPYSLLKPDEATIERLGPVPVPPWVTTL